MEAPEECRKRKRDAETETTTTTTTTRVTMTTSLLLDLPHEILFGLLGYMNSAVDLCHLGATCKALYARIADPLVWERLYRALPGTLADAAPIQWKYSHRWLYHARTSSPEVVVARACKKRRLTDGDLGETAHGTDANSVYRLAKQTTECLEGKCVLTTHYDGGRLQYHGWVSMMVPHGYGVMVVIRDGAIDQKHLIEVGDFTWRVKVMKRTLPVVSGPQTDHLKAGDWFEGLWSMGTLRSGRASFQCDPTHRYTGQIADGLPSGDGTLSLSPTGVVAYNGEWLNGRYHGWGTLYGENGDYEGSMKYGQACGWGTTRNHGGKVYEGNFLTDKFEGWGTLRYASGIVHTGYFSASVPDGRGTRIGADGRVTRGEWKAGKLCGYATESMPSRPDQTDSCEDGQHRRTDTWHSECHYKNNERCGPATYTYASGARFAGHYSKGKKHGVGTLVYNDGTVRSGEWSEGELLVACFDCKSADASGSHDLDEPGTGMAAVGFHPDAVSVAIDRPPAHEDDLPPTDPAREICNGIVPLH